jgi:predicted KAP-like P-loop ATPase
VNESTRSVADDPIDGSQASPDTLGRSGFARAVATAIAPLREQASSSVVALVGPWGSGKTSLMNLAMARLREDETKSTWNLDHLNPWLFPDLASLQVGFLGALQGAVGRKRKLRGRRIRSAIGSVGKRIAPLGAFGAIAGWNLSEAFKGLSDLIAGQENPTKDQDALESLLKKERTPVLVVLDDLDRLAPNELLLVFKLIRLVGRLPYVHYLVMYDEDTLLDVLSRTGLVGKKDVRRASDYLEKMIQLRLDVPPLRASQVSTLVDEAINGMAGTIGLEVDDDQRARFAMAYQGHLRRRLNTPRTIKRYVTQVEAMYPSLGAEVDPVDFLLLTWIRTAEPLLYTRLPAEKVDLTGAGDLFDAFRQGRQKPSERRATWVNLFATAKVAPEHLDGVADVLGALFPRFKEIWNDSTSFGSGDPAIRRVANRDYFDRYFAFDVPEEDFLDSTAAAAYAAILDGRETSETRALAEILVTKTDLAINKVEALFRQDRDGSSARSLLLWLAPLASSVSEARDLFSARDRVQALCSRLYLQLEPDEAVLNEVLNEVSRVDLGMELGSRLIGAAESSPFTGSAEDVEARTRVYPLARAHFAGLIKKEFERHREASVFELPKETWSLIWAWRTIEPEMARRWIRIQVEAGRWTRLELAARLVASRAPVGVPNPVWKLSELDFDVVEDLIGVSALIKEVGEDRIMSTPLQEMRDVEATEETRRDFVLQALRRRLTREKRGD